MIGEEGWSLIFDMLQSRLIQLGYLKGLIEMAGPATKFGSLTGHGGTVIGPGCLTVLINKVPAIRIGADIETLIPDHPHPLVRVGSQQFMVVQRRLR